MAGNDNKNTSKKDSKKFLWRIDFVCIVLIFALSFPTVKSLLQSGFFQTHDGDGHIARLYWFDKAIKQGHFPVRWIDEINRGRGYPFFNFYYPLLYYLAEVPYVLGVGLVDSLKLVLVLSFPVSGVAMYFWIKQLWGKWAGLVAAILLMYAPYRFVGVYISARFGETVAFVFIPAALATITLWLKTKHRLWLGLAILFWAAIVLSHNIQALIFFPFVLAYALVMRGGKDVFVIMMLALGVSAYFWMPAMVEKTWTLQGQHVAYDFRSNFPSIKAYFYQPWGYGLNTTGQTGGVSLQLGLAQWAALGAGILGIKRKEPLSKFLFLWAGLTFFLMNRISLPLWNVLPLLPQIQIPSRLLGMMMFLAAAWAGLVARQHKFVAMAIVILALYSNRNYLRPGYFERYHDDYYEHNLELLYGTTDPYGENMPVWSNFTQDTFADKIVADPRSPAKPTISNILIKPRWYGFAVESTAYSWVKIKSLYYPGWKLEIDGKQKQFQFEQAYGQDEQAHLQVAIPAGKHKIKVWWEETVFRKIANVISLVSLTVVGLVFVTKKEYRPRD